MSMFWVLWGIQLVLILFFFKYKSDPPSSAPRYLSGSSVVFSSIAFRLLYLFALIGSGYHFLIMDDPCRWVMAEGWARDPYLITWDGVWLGGTFYVHGLAMKIIGDPLFASKIVSGLFHVILFMAVFVFAKSLKIKPGIAAAATLLVAPYWIHLLIGTGTLTEIPQTTFLLLGVGLLIFALRDDAPRLEMLTLSALSFVLSSAFHTVAWIYLICILVTLLIVLLRRRDLMSFGQWLIFSFASSAYCFFWFFGCWIKFGHPLAFVIQQTQLNQAYLPEQVSKIGLLATYPASLWDLIAPVFPLTLVGVLLALKQSRASRAVVLGALGTVLVFCATTLFVQTSVTPFRAMVPLATLLLVFAAIPFDFDALRLSRNPAPSAFKRLYAGAICLFALTWVLINHHYVFERRHMVEDRRPAAHALGEWLRQSDLGQRYDLSKPILFYVPAGGYVNETIVAQYLSGLGYSIVRTESLDSAVHHNQMILTPEVLTEARFSLATWIGDFHVYRVDLWQKP